MKDFFTFLSVRGFNTLLPNSFFHEFYVHKFLDYTFCIFSRHFKAATVFSIILKCITCYQCICTVLVCNDKREISKYLCFILFLVFLGKKG